MADLVVAIQLEQVIEMQDLMKLFADQAQCHKMVINQLLTGEEGAFSGPVGSSNTSVAKVGSMLEHTVCSESTKGWFSHTDICHAIDSWKLSSILNEKVALFKISMQSANKIS